MTIEYICESCRMNNHITECKDCGKDICGNCERKCKDYPKIFCVSCWTGRKSKRPHPRRAKHVKINDAHQPDYLQFFPTFLHD